MNSGSTLTDIQLDAGAFANLLAYFCILLHTTD